MLEEWKPIEGYESYYSVSSLGRVRSESRVIVRSTGHEHRVGGRVLKPKIDAGGYACYTLSRGDKATSVKAHRLVADAFIQNTAEHSSVLHGPNGVSDNSASNLYWGTQKQNMQDKQRDGTCRESNKTHCPQGHEYSLVNTYARPNKIERQCKSCKAARNYFRSNPDSTESLQQVSDRYYLALCHESHSKGLLSPQQSSKL